MCAIILLCWLSTGIESTWTTQPDGTTEYVIQLSEAELEALKAGLPITSAIPPEAQRVGVVKLQFGSRPLQKPALPQDSGRTGGNFSTPALGGGTNSILRGNSSTNPATTNATPSTGGSSGTNTAIGSTQFNPIPTTSQPTPSQPNTLGQGGIPTTGRNFTQDRVSPAQAFAESQLAANAKNAADKGKLSPTNAGATPDAASRPGSNLGSTAFTTDQQPIQVPADMQNPGQYGSGTLGQGNLGQGNFGSVVNSPNGNTGIVPPYLGAPADNRPTYGNPNTQQPPQYQGPYNQQPQHQQPQYQPTQPNQPSAADPNYWAQYPYSPTISPPPLLGSNQQGSIQPPYAPNYNTQTNPNYNPNYPPGYGAGYPNPNVAQGQPNGYPGTQTQPTGTGLIPRAAIDMASTSSKPNTSKGLGGGQLDEDDDTQVSHSKSKVTTPSTDEDDTKTATTKKIDPQDNQWLTTGMLFLSIGLNAYLGFLLRGFLIKTRQLARELRESIATI